MVIMMSHDIKYSYLIKYIVAYATEALGNIRTVKAFASERYEQQRYNEAIDSALEKGIQDAFGGAGMYAINSYLELGAAVLILWYGGKMAMEDKHGMTPGRLITYQLYWNMLNSAYKNLLDIVTSFTRAAGAAQRVFDLMDSLPDIDIDAGMPVVPGTMKGHLEFRHVSFAYQMRPTSLVLNGINLVIPSGTTCAFVGRSGGG
jgi:ATP-binding cassette subfamily B protein